MTICGPTLCQALCQPYVTESSQNPAGDSLLRSPFTDKETEARRSRSSGQGHSVTGAWEPAARLEPQQAPPPGEASPASGPLSARRGGGRGLPPSPLSTAGGSHGSQVLPGLHAFHGSPLPWGAVSCPLLGPGSPGHSHADPLRGALQNCASLCLHLPVPFLGSLSPSGFFYLPLVPWSAPPPRSQPATVAILRASQRPGEDGASSEEWSGGSSVTWPWRQAGGVGGKGLEGSQHWGSGKRKENGGGRDMEGTPGAPAGGQRADQGPK